MVRSAQSEVVAAATRNAAAPSADSRASGVVPALGAPAEGRAKDFSLDTDGGADSVATNEDDIATTVDAGHEALSEEQRAVLAERIYEAMQQTLPRGAPSPASVRANAVVGSFTTHRALPAPAMAMAASMPAAVVVAPADTERTPISFKRTMLLGLPHPPNQLPSPPPAASEAPDSSALSALRASLVRDVGPPTTPPPRRSRRPSMLSGADVHGADLSAAELPATDLSARAGLEPEDHDAFHLKHRVVSPETLSPMRATNGWRALPEVSPERLSSITPATGLILPPPPGAWDFDPPSAPGAPRLSARPPERRHSQIVAPVPLASPTRHSVEAGPIRQTLLTDLPSLDPFAGFIAPPATFIQRWAVVLVVALAVVGLFALGAIAFGFLGKTGW